MAALNLGELLLTLGFDVATFKKDAASAQKSISAVEAGMEKTATAADKAAGAITGAGSKSAKASATAEKASAAATAAAVKAQAAQERAAKATAEAAAKAGTNQEKASAKAAAAAEKDAARTAAAAERAYAKATDAAEKSAAAQAKAIEKASISAKFDQIGQSFDRIGSKMQAAGTTLSAALTLPIVGAGVAIGKTAMNYESAFAGVRKTVDATEEQFKELSEGIREMSLEMPASAVSIANVAEAAGQLGIKTAGILNFSETMIKLGTTTNLSATDAATALARLANITQMPQTEFDKLGSTVVALGNNLATTEAEIVQMGLRMAGAGKTIGLTEAQILSFAGALSSVGVDAEAGGTAFSRVMVNIQNEVKSAGKNLALFAAVSGMSAEQFTTAFETDASGAIASFIEGLGRLQASGTNVFPVLDQLELGEIRVRDALLRASGAGDLFRTSLEIGSKAWEENTALNKEAAERYKTTESRLQLVKNAVTDVGITLGESMLPAIQNVLGAMKPWLDSLKEAAERFNALDKETQASYVKMGLIAAAIGPALILFGTLAKVVGYAIEGIVGFGNALTYLSLHPAVAIGVALAAIVLGGVAVAASMKNQREEAEREGQALADLTKEYDKLTEAIDDSTKSEEERLKAAKDQKKLIQEIGEQFPDLVKSWDDHGLAVELDTKRLRENTKAASDNIRTKNQAAITAAQSEIAQIEKNLSRLKTQRDLIAEGKMFGSFMNAGTNRADVTQGLDADIAAQLRLLEKANNKLHAAKLGLLRIETGPFNPNDPADIGVGENAGKKSRTSSGGSRSSSTSESRTAEQRQADEELQALLGLENSKKKSKEAEEARRLELEKTTFQLEQLDDAWRLYQVQQDGATDSADYQSKRTQYQADRLEILKQRLADTTAQYDAAKDSVGEFATETMALGRIISQTDLEIAETKNPTFALTAKEKKSDAGKKALEQTSYQLDQLDSTWQTFRTQQDGAAEDADFLAKREEYLASRMGLLKQRLADASAQYEAAKKNLGEFADETKALGQIVAQTNQEIAETGTADFGKSKSKAFLDDFEKAFKQSQDSMLDKFKENQDDATIKMRQALGEQRAELKADQEIRAADQEVALDESLAEVKSRHAERTKDFERQRKEELAIEERYLDQRRKLFEAGLRADQKAFTEARRLESVAFGDALDDKRDAKRTALAQELQLLRDYQAQEIDVIRNRYDAEAALRDANLAAKIAPFQAGLDALRKQEADEAQLQKIAEMEREVRDAREGIDKAFASNSMEQIAAARQKLADVLKKQEAEITKDRRRAEMDRLQASIDAAVSEAAVADKAAKAALDAELTSTRTRQDVAMAAAQQASAEKLKAFEKELREEIAAENKRVDALREVFQEGQEVLREAERAKLNIRAEAYSEQRDADKANFEKVLAQELENEQAEQERLREKLKRTFAIEDKALADRQAEFQLQWQRDQEAQGKRYKQELEDLKASLKDKLDAQRGFLQDWSSMQSQMGNMAPGVAQAPLTKTQANANEEAVAIARSLARIGRTEEAAKVLVDAGTLTPEQAIKNVESMAKDVFEFTGGGGGGNHFLMGDGGITTGAINPIIGERGPEAVIPLTQLWARLGAMMQDFSDSITSRMAFGTGIMSEGGQAAIAGVAGSNIDVNVFIGNRQIDDLWVESKERNTRRGRG